MAKITEALVVSFAEQYSTAQLTTWLQAAQAALVADLPRVEMTGANFKEGGSSGQYVQGKPEFVVELTQRALKLKEAIDATDTVSNRAMVHGDLSRRAVGW